MQFLGFDGNYIYIYSSLIHGRVVNTRVSYSSLSSHILYAAGVGYPPLSSPPLPMHNHISSRLCQSASSLADPFPDLLDTLISPLSSRQYIFSQHASSKSSQSILSVATRRFPGYVPVHSFSFTPNSIQPGHNTHPLQHFHSCNFSFYFIFPYTLIWTSSPHDEGLVTTQRFPFHL